jgi:hypothetical protein
MELSKAVAGLAVILAVMLVTGHASGTEKETVQDRAAAREAVRRLEIAQHQQRKEDFARRCAKPLMTAAELAACRAAYRRL